MDPIYVQTQFTCYTNIITDNTSHCTYIGINLSLHIKNERSEYLQAHASC